jgi:DNA-binding MarR family transcriptional regulator
MPRAARMCPGTPIARVLAMPPDSGLEFDPIARAGELWEKNFGDPTAMKFVTSVMRAQQLLIGSLDSALRPFGITFARYEVLVLIRFSRDGSLPLSKIGQRLQVHPTSVTNAIDRLVAQGLVVREADEADRRRILASLTPEGERVVREATDALNAIEFAASGLDAEHQRTGFDVLRVLRESSGDFTE